MLLGKEGSQSSAVPGCLANVACAPRRKGNLYFVTSWSLATPSCTTWHVSRVVCECVHYPDRTYNLKVAATTCVLFPVAEQLVQYKLNWLVALLNYSYCFLLLLVS